MVLPFGSPIMVSMRGGEGATGMQVHGGKQINNVAKLITLIILI